MTQSAPQSVPLARALLREAHRAILAALAACLEGGAAGIRIPLSPTGGGP